MRLGSKLRTRRFGVKTRAGVVKIGPNEQCPCGSGSKYKKCCGGESGLFGIWHRYRAKQLKIKQLSGSVQGAARDSE